MSDDADRAEARQEEVMSDALAKVRRAGGLPYTGACHNCGDITGGGRRFCDSDCRDDYQRRIKLKGINGHVR